MADLDTITGSVLIDRHGDAVGKVTDVLVEPRTLRPAWAVVTYGVLQRQHRNVPITRMYEAGDRARRDERRVLADLRGFHGTA